MNKEELKQKLREKPGYRKSGAPNLSRIFGVSKNLAKAAVREVNKEVEESANVVIVNDTKSQYQEFLEWQASKGVKETKKEEEVEEDVFEEDDNSAPSLRDQAGMHILMGCNHVPFENKQLHKGALKLIRDYKSIIKGFHLMGDFLDINTLSSHDKGRFTAVKGLTLDMEYDAGNILLDKFDGELPEDCWKTYLYGNHEDRWNRWMTNMDNAKTPLTSPEVGLGLRHRGYQVKNRWSQDFFTIGKDFEIFHGIYFSIHCAKAHLDKLRTSCAFVHTHRSQTYREGQKAAYNIGSCADFSSKAFNYATRPMKAQWSNGFAINMVDANGNSNVTQIHVNPDGHFWFGGKFY